jgi:predicted RNase H-like nuclease
MLSVVGLLGVDACRPGWAGVVVDDGGFLAGLFSADLVTLVRKAASIASLDAVGVDMPIGLPDTGRRAADVLARRFVGPRWQSVFMTPVRAALAEATHAAASRRNRELTGEGISQQAFALRPRLAEVAAWASASPVPVFEVHPEVSFAMLAGAPVSSTKKTWAGVAQRRTLLSGVGIDLPGNLGSLGAHAGVDDVLDAAVAAWSARRCAAGTARSFPDPPELFSDGHASAIWA